ncbi:alcohol dehydrogenase [Penicillium concentricum]|uniref:Alcohol dehydrogenase n=1 Tax=Penicillium concentricum TaxID=293559 RepID=A0A9W9R9F4_9EURO|nr:alcohol dehydrogenase [Penicillium concentricum]KAJ5356011.1 alcohol dehydrogenase [Penicillium concentricum]
MDVSFEVYRGSPSSHIVSDTTTRRLGLNEVYIEITHSGICGTDEHFLKSTQVLGHEGVGIIRLLGSNVTTVKVGDRVGFGYVRKVCGACDNCGIGWDQYCRSARVYGECDFDIGTFCHGTVWDASCIFVIPDGYLSEDAAPLICAGATVWNCLTHFGARPVDRVGIVGVGGLGHLAIKIAAEMGCHVVVLSRSDDKKEDALQYGADEFYIMDQIDRASFRPLKHLLLCGSYLGDLASLIRLMDTNGTIYPMTATLTETLVPFLPMNSRGIRIQGTRVASRQDLRELIEFCNRKKIKPTIVKFPMTPDGIKEAMQKLKNGEIKYRAVLVRELPPVATPVGCLGV